MKLIMVEVTDEAQETAVNEVLKARKKQVASGNNPDLPAGMDFELLTQTAALALARVELAIAQVFPEKRP